MQIKYIENRTGQAVTFQRFILSGWGGTQIEKTHELELVQGYNALPDDAAEVPEFYYDDRPPFTPSEKDVPYKEYFESSRIDLIAFGSVSWRYSYFPKTGHIRVARGGDFGTITAIDIVGQQGEMTSLKKIKIIGNNLWQKRIYQVAVTKEELERITVELARRWKPD